jgi:hypothetical protein
VLPAATLQDQIETVRSVHCRAQVQDVATAKPADRDHRHAPACFLAANNNF